VSDTIIIGHCWSCAKGLVAADYGREQSCPGCGKATRVCRNCRHFAPGRPNDCIEPMAERVLEKTKANFCEYFEATKTPLGDPQPSSDETLREAAEALFRS
jgi:predicted RNA-binding Zn-ribbon protein involved in translation (DUF1610 family)